eukprot:g19701.t1
MAPTISTKPLCPPLGGLLFRSAATKFLFGASDAMSAVAMLTLSSNKNKKKSELIQQLGVDASPAPLNKPQTNSGGRTSGRKDSGATGATISSSEQPKMKGFRVPRPPSAAEKIASCWKETDCETARRDANGSYIEAHGGHVLLHENVYYWYGEGNKLWGPGTSPPHYNVYSSSSLAGPWQFHPEGVITNEAICKHAKAPNKRKEGLCGITIVERPRVLYNPSTKKFVMWSHLDNDQYALRLAGVFQAERPTGPFSVMDILQPGGEPSLDLNVFQDPRDETGYLIRDARIYPGDTRAVTMIHKLRPDYLDVVDGEGPINTISPVIEGMAVFFEQIGDDPQHWNLKSKRKSKDSDATLKTSSARTSGEGRWWVVASGLNGWKPAKVSVLKGKWNAPIEELNFHSAEEVVTLSETNFFNLQPTSVVRAYDGNSRPYFVLAGDNWLHAKRRPNKDCPKVAGRGNRNYPGYGPELVYQLCSAGYIWMPFQFFDTSKVEQDSGRRMPLVKGPWTEADPFGIYFTMGNAVAKEKEWWYGDSESDFSVTKGGLAKSCNERSGVYIGVEHNATEVAVQVDLWDSEAGKLEWTQTLYNQQRPGWCETGGDPYQGRANLKLSRSIVLHIFGQEEGKTKASKREWKNIFWWEKTKKRLVSVTVAADMTVKEEYANMAR